MFLDSIKIKLDYAGIVDHGVMASDDYAMVTIPVQISLENRQFNLNFQSINGYNFEAIPRVDLNSSSGDDRDALYTVFDHYDEDDDKISGEYHSDCECIIILATSIAQRAFDQYFEEKEKEEETK